MNRRAPHTVLLALVFALTLAACGGGGAAAPALPPAPAEALLTIVQAALPAGSTTASYPATQFQSEGAEGVVVWETAGGALPDGITLSPQGVLSGTPTAVGFFPFTVSATDDLTSVTEDFAIDVADLGFAITGGLTLGAAWTSAPLALAASDAQGDVSFTVVENNSGGSYSAADAAAGTVVWTPGATGDVSDVLRATDTTSLRTADLTVEIVTNPVENHVAAFGSTDVWYLDFGVKRGDHDYATDLHAALVDVGLWPSTSTNEPTSELEVLLDLLVRVQILREVNLLYLRESDGSAGNDGHAITFPIERPDAALYDAPNVAGWSDGAADEYSVMEFSVSLTGTNALGRAYSDPGNPYHDHNGGGNLGTFVDKVTDYFESNQSDLDLGDDPVDADDIGILRALLYGQELTGARFVEVRDLVETYARGLAVVSGHEIGHSVGLSHGSGLMASSASFSDSALAPGGLVFVAADLTTLGTTLPGPGRSVSALTLFGTTSHDVTEGGRVIHEIFGAPVPHRLRKR